MFRFGTPLGNPYFLVSGVGIRYRPLFFLFSAEGCENKSTSVFLLFLKKSVECSIPPTPFARISEKNCPPLIGLPPRAHFLPEWGSPLCHLFPHFKCEYCDLKSHYPGWYPVLGTHPHRFGVSQNTTYQLKCDLFKFYEVRLETGRTWTFRLISGRKHSTAIFYQVGGWVWHTSSFQNYFDLKSK